MAFTFSGILSWVNIVGFFFILAGIWNLVMAVVGRKRAGEAAAAVAEAVAEKGASAAEEGREWLGAALSKERRLGRALRRTGSKIEKHVEEIIKGYERLKKAIEDARTTPALLDVVVSHADKIFPVINKSMEIIEIFEKEIASMEKWDAGEIGEIKKIAKEMEGKETLVKPELKKQVDAYLKTMRDLVGNSTASVEQLEEMKKVAEEVKKLDEEVKKRNDEIIDNLKLRSISGLNNAIIGITQSLKELNEMRDSLVKVADYIKNVQALIIAARNLVRHVLKKEVDRIMSEVTREAAGRERPLPLGPGP